MRRVNAAVAVAVILSFAGAQPAFAAACSGDSWQPTFVHDLENPDGPWYVLNAAAGQFVKLKQSGNPPTWIAEACSDIATSGVRDPTGFTTCEDYTRIQCGCTRADLSNSTCAVFLRQHTRTFP